VWGFSGAVISASAFSIDSCGKVNAVYQLMCLRFSPTGKVDRVGSEWDKHSYRKVISQYSTKHNPKISILKPKI
jgi:hypothetical protein